MDNLESESYFGHKSALKVILKINPKYNTGENILSAHSLYRLSNLLCLNLKERNKQNQNTYLPGPQHMVLVKCIYFITVHLDCIPFS